MYIKEKITHMLACPTIDTDPAKEMLQKCLSVITFLESEVALRDNRLAESKAEVERLKKLCHRAAKYIAANNRLADLIKGESEVSRLYIDLVAEVHLGEEEG